MKEVSVLRDVMALGVGLVRLFRNSTGKVQDPRTGNWIRYGLTEGSSDLIGWQSMTITPDMVGQRVAVFVALECKSDSGRASWDQRRFIEAVRAAGGIGAIIRSAAEAQAALQTSPAASAPTSPRGRA